MLSKKLAGLSGASFVEYGYGQVEPNHLSARRTGQIYAQLPAAADINKLEQGQFVKYDYLNEEVNFTGAGEWMLVYNEVKLYRDEQVECEFAMLKDNYVARIYSPVEGDVNWDAQSRYYNGGEFTWTGDAETFQREKVTAPEQPRDDWNYNEDPFHIASKTSPKAMKSGTTMVPRVFKTNVGDIYTTNCVNLDKTATNEELLGKVLAPNANGYLSVVEDSAEGMKWQVVKVYTMPDRQKGVKIMRIA